MKRTVLLLAILIAGSAKAQRSPRVYEDVNKNWLGISATGNHYRGDILNADNTIGVQLRYEHEVTDLFHIAGELGYTRLSATDKSMHSQGENIFSRPWLFKSHTAQAIVFGSVDLLNTYYYHDWTPYIEAGAGALYYNTKAKENADGVTAVIPVGIGLKWYIRDDIRLHVGARYYPAFTDKLDAYKWNYTGKSDNFLSLLVGLSIRLGRGHLWQLKDPDARRFL